MADKEALYNKMASICCIAAQPFHLRTQYSKAIIQLATWRRLEAQTQLKAAVGSVLAQAAVEALRVVKTSVRVAHAASRKTEQLAVPRRRQPLPQSLPIPKMSRRVHQEGVAMRLPRRRLPRRHAPASHLLEPQTPMAMPMVVAG